MGYVKASMSKQDGVTPNSCSQNDPKHVWAYSSFFAEVLVFLSGHLMGPLPFNLLFYVSL